jgi:hypothetical protein
MSCFWKLRSGIQTRRISPDKKRLKNESECHFHFLIVRIPHEENRSLNTDKIWECGDSAPLFSGAIRRDACVAGLTNKLFVSRRSPQRCDLRLFSRKAALLRPDGFAGQAGGRRGPDTRATSPPPGQRVPRAAASSGPRLIKRAQTRGARSRPVSAHPAAWLFPSRPLRALCDFA